MESGDRAVLVSEMESLRSEFTFGLSSVRDQVVKLREELAADRGTQGTLWAVHQKGHDFVDAEHLHARLVALEQWRIEMMTLGRLVKMTFGASVIGAVAALVALWETLNHTIGGR